MSPDGMTRCSVFGDAPAPQRAAGALAELEAALREATDGARAYLEDSRRVFAGEDGDGATPSHPAAAATTADTATGVSASIADADPFLNTTYAVGSELPHDDAEETDTAPRTPSLNFSLRLAPSLFDRGDGEGVGAANVAAAAASRQACEAKVNALMAAIAKVDALRCSGDHASSTKEPRAAPAATTPLLDVASSTTSSPFSIVDMGQAAAGSALLKRRQSSFPTRRASLPVPSEALGQAPMTHAFAGLGDQRSEEDGSVGATSAGASDVATPFGECAAATRRRWSTGSPLVIVTSPAEDAGPEGKAPTAPSRAAGGVASTPTSTPPPLRSPQSSFSMSRAEMRETLKAAAAPPPPPSPKFPRRASSGSVGSAPATHHPPLLSPSTSFSLPRNPSGSSFGLRASPTTSPQAVVSAPRMQMSPTGAARPSLLCRRSNTASTLLGGGGGGGWGGAAGVPYLQETQSLPQLDIWMISRQETPSPAAPPALAGAATTAGSTPVCMLGELGSGTPVTRDAVDIGILPPPLRGGLAADAEPRGRLGVSVGRSLSDGALCVSERFHVADGFNAWAENGNGDGGDVATAPASPRLPVRRASEGTATAAMTPSSARGRPPVSPGLSQLVRSTTEVLLALRPQ